jgi:RNA-directed DNA polymerase
MQYRIYKAKKVGNTKLLHNLQIKLINSFDAKLLSVLQVTTLNKGKSTSGVDKLKYVDGNKKIMLARSLKLDGTAKPIRRVWITKPGKLEKQPLLVGIPTIMDRAKQNLVKLALEPEWEAVFEPNSYGFRPGRSCHDAIEAIFLSLRHKRKKKSKFVFDADIRKCFDRIDHAALLKKLSTFPQMEHQIKAWLEASIMEEYAYSPNNIDPSTRTTPLRKAGIISPLLANIALHGLEEHLKSLVESSTMTTKTFKPPNKKDRRSALTVVRYADNFVIIHENKEILKACINETINWLLKIGLEISQEKSSLKDTRRGFNFLGFQIIQLNLGEKYNVKIKPSQQSCKRFLTKIQGIIQKNKASSSFELIAKLRPVIIGWANYFRFSECIDTFSKLDYSIFQKLRAWVLRRDRRNGRMKIKEKYFPSGRTYTFRGKNHRNNWILTGKRKTINQVEENFLPILKWINSEKHVKIKGNFTPYDGNHLYWAKRLSKYSSLSPCVQSLLEKQKYKCAICKVQFEEKDIMEIDHIIPKKKGGPNTYTNLQLLHKTCHNNKTLSERNNDSTTNLV